MASVSTDRRRGVMGTAAIKVPCIAASTANLTLSGEQTIDGISLVTDDRVFVKDQTDGTENGIYYVNSSDWERAPDWDGRYDVVEGTIVPVSRGTVNADTYWRVTNTGVITVGTTNLTTAATTVLDSAILNDGSVKMIADFLPQVADTYDIGSTLLPFEDGHFNGDVAIGGSAAVTGSISSGGLSVGSIDVANDTAKQSAVASNHVRAGAMQFYVADSANSQLWVTTALAQSTWESIGPTGSGADNIFSAMDVIPSDARAVMFELELSIESLVQVYSYVGVSAVDGDTSPTAAAENFRIASITYDPETGTGDEGVMGVSQFVILPINSGLVFKMYWTKSGSASNEFIGIRYKGFITG